jgi:diguanylate cyclase (GGDEF)-like protein/PAS domain S-box-containing protein
MNSGVMLASSLNRAAAASSPDASADESRLQDLCRLLVDAAGQGMYAVDSLGFTRFVNPAAAALTGWAMEELLGKPQEIFVSQLPGLNQEGVVDPAADGRRRGEDALFLRKDGTTFPAAYTSVPVVRDGRLSATVVVFEDISEKRRAEAWEKTRAAIFAAILSHQSLVSTFRMLASAFVARYPGRAVAIFSRHEGELHLEAEAGLPPRSPHTAQISPGFPEILSSGVELCLASTLLSRSGEDRGMVAVFDARGATLDDGIRGTIQRVCDLACVAMEHQHLYEEMALHAGSDAARALPGRHFLENCLREAIVSAQRRGKLVAVCCLDIDRLKLRTDSLGHEWHDALAKAVSDRLNQSIRDVDIPAQYAGAEFMLALCQLNQPADAEEICRRLLTALKAPFLVKGISLTITAGIGISLYPQHGDAPGILLDHANTALQAVRQTDRGGVQIYSAALGKKSQRAAEMPEALLAAIQQGQFCIVYQPIFAVNTRIAGFEALLRWKHPDWGLINPMDFIAIAERTGLIVPIGDWVIREVCRQAIAWDAASLPPVKMFANVSGVQLERPDFSSKIANTLLESGLSPDRLELEITESWVISDLKAAARKLMILRDLGIGIAIDDFGTGYSTFDYLQELPVDTVKIDRSFIQRLDGPDARPATVPAMTAMAQQMGLKIVAEGVETAQQAATLAAIGCDLMQGYYLGRPAEPCDAAALLKKQQAFAPFSTCNAPQSDPQLAS